jgi:hypothetical protein
MMQQSYKSYGTLAVIALALASLSSVARADVIYLDNHISITGYSTSTGASSPPLSSAAGSSVMSMAFATSGTPTQYTLLTADESGGISAYTLNGVKSTFGSVANPLGLAIGPNGYVYVGANNGTTIEQLTASGTFIKNIATGVQEQSIAVDAYGNVFEADDCYGNNCTESVVEYYASGGSAVYGSAQVDGGNGDNMYGMAFDSSGDLFVTYQATSAIGGGIDEIKANGTLTQFYAATTTLASPTLPVKPDSLAYDPSSGDLYMSYANSNGVGGGILMFSDGTGGTLSGGTVSTFETFASGSLNAIAFEAPEPGTWLLFVAGLILTYLLRSRLIRL